MAFKHDRAICLRKVEFSETSQILLLFTRDHGLQRVIAKGAHRRTKAGSSKFDGGIDLLEVGMAVFSQKLDKDLGLLTEWSLREGHPLLRQNLRSMHLGLYAAELTGLVFEEHDPHPEVFDRLEHTLMEIGSPRTEESFLSYQLYLIRESGYFPELGGCVNCQHQIGPKDPVHFSADRGGILCQLCCKKDTRSMPLDPRLLGLMQSMLKLPRSPAGTIRLPRLTRHQTDPINRILAAHIRHIMQKPMMMPKWVL